MSKIISLVGTFLLLALVISDAGDLLTYFPKMSSETYLFALNNKRLNKLSWIAIPEQENDLEKLKALFVQKGFKPGVIPEDKIARSLETGIID